MKNKKIDVSKYRAFKSREEFMEQRIFPVCWVKFKDTENWYMITGIIKDGVWLSDQFLNWSEMLNRVVFIDGSPCGVKL